MLCAHVQNFVNDAIFMGCPVSVSVAQARQKVVLLFHIKSVETGISMCFNVMCRTQKCNNGFASGPCASWQQWIAQVLRNCTGRGADCLRGGRASPGSLVTVTSLSAKRSASSIPKVTGCSHNKISPVRHGIGSIRRQRVFVTSSSGTQHSNSQIVTPPRVRLGVFAIRRLRRP